MPNKWMAISTPTRTRVNPITASGLICIFDSSTSMYLTNPAAEDGNCVFSFLPFAFTI